MNIPCNFLYFVDRASYYNDSLFTNLIHKFFILIHLLLSSTCLEHYYAHFRGTILLVQYMVSSLSLGDCSVHRLREEFSRNLCILCWPGIKSEALSS